MGTLNLNTALQAQISSVSVSMLALFVVLAIIVITIFLLISFIIKQDSFVNDAQVINALNNNNGTNITVINHKTINERYEQLAHNQLDALKEMRQQGLIGTKQYSDAIKKLNTYLRKSKGV